MTHQRHSKKYRKKNPRLERSGEEEDDDLEIVVDKFDDEDDFIPFENENECENEGHEGGTVGRCCSRVVGGGCCGVAFRGGWFD